MKIGPPSFWGAKRQRFGTIIQAVPSLDSRCTEMRSNSWNTKTTGITTISRLPSHTSLVKFGLGEFKLQRSHKLYISASGPAISRNWQYVQNYRLEYAESIKYGLFDGVALLGTSQSVKSYFAECEWVKWCHLTKPWNVMEWLIQFI